MEDEMQPYDEPVYRLYSGGDMSIRMVCANCGWERIFSEGVQTYMLGIMQVRHESAGCDG